MVATANGNLPDTDGSVDNLDQRHCCSTFYLHTILKDPMKEKTTYSRKQVLETTAVLATFFLILSAVTKQKIYVWPALALLIIALFIKPLAVAITRIWLQFSEVIGGITNRIILSLLFVLVLTPIALLFRLFNKNPLGIKRANDKTSYYHDRNHTYTSEDLDKMG